jgi:hypothetical protein
MDAKLTQRFGELGARVKETISPRIRARQLRRNPAQAVFLAGQQATLRIDIGRDPAGEYFDVQRGADVAVRILDVEPSDRHLVLQAKVPAGRGFREATFLCGHDEYHWFVAAIPETAAARTVQNAKDALKPRAVWQEMTARKVPMADRNLRRTAAFVRQGEWFFLPRPELQVQDSSILRREPIRRGAGKPHLCEELIRSGGEKVFVCQRHPNGLTEDQFWRLAEAERNRHRWRTMQRGALAYARGYVRHPDHDTVRLECWHEIVPNTETQASAMREVAFLD